MKKAGLIGLVILMFTCIPGYGQADSARHLSGVKQSIADSNNGIAADTHRATVTPTTLEKVAETNTMSGEPITGTGPVVQHGYGIYWLIGCALLGIILGVTGQVLLHRASARGKKSGRGGALQTGSTGQQADDGGFVQQWNLEQEHARLGDANKALMLENDQLKRDKGELEQLLKSANGASGMSAMNARKEIVFYMPQPNMNGRFQEASKRMDAADALYAFRVARDNQSTATFEFIAKDAYLNAAIGNEPSWISIACDRTNQPSGTTTRVKTESPGMASLKDGEWEITRKAKITYL